jgi:hypothetical protein
MSEKEKPKRSTRMGFLRSCLIFSLYPLLILGLLGCGFVYWLNGGYVKPSLDPEYIPTAEYLLANPIEITKREMPYYPPIIEFDETRAIDQLCFWLVSEHSSDYDNVLWAEVLINEQLLYPKFIFRTEFHTLPGATDLCVYGLLFSGLHIIEFRLKESPAAEPYYIQRWAIEIP